MSTAVYDTVDYQHAAARGGKGPFAMTKTNVKSLAYFLIVGGVVVWIVGHLSPIRG